MSLPSFRDSKGNLIDDFDDFTISGMDNGVYYYGSAVDGLSSPPSDITYLIGSTYKVTVSLTNSNYKLSGDNFFILKYKTVLINGSYYTIEDALSPDKSGTITLLGDNSSAKSYIATSFTKLTQTELARMNVASEYKNYYADYSYTLNNRTLVVPYKDNCEDAVYTDKVNHTSGNVYAALIIPNDVTISLTSGSILSAAAYIGYGTPSGSSAMSATITCERGVILNNGTIIASSGSTVNSYGYIKGDGTLKLENGSSAMDIIRTYDWPGGSAGSKMYQTVFPTNAFTMHNISCDTYIYAGAIYKISMHVMMSALGYTLAPLASGIVVGNSGSENCMFQPVSDGRTDTYIFKEAAKASVWDKDHKSALALSSITGSNQIYGQKEILTINGDYKDNEFKVNLSLAIYNVDFATNTGVAIPISYMDIELAKNSTLILEKSDYMFMPGTYFKVNQGAIVTIGDGVDLAFLTVGDLADSTYVSGSRDFNTFLVDNTEDSYMDIKGTVNVVSGKVGGKIIASAHEAIFNLKSGTNTTSVKSMYNTESPYYIEFTSVANGYIPATSTSGNSSFASETAYVSQTTKADDGTESYYWMSIPNTDLSKYILEFYDENGKNILATRTIYTYKTTTHDVTGSEFSYNKLHYEQTKEKWYVMDIGVTDDDGKYTASQIINASLSENNKTIAAGTTIRLKALLVEKTYYFGFNFDYIYTDNSTGETIRETIDKNDVSPTLPETFTKSSFISDGNGNYVLTLPENLSYNGEETFNGWYLGSDASTNFLIKTITLSQFETYLSQKGTDRLYLYGEFSESFVTINLTDTTHSTNKAIDTTITIPKGSSIAESNRIFKVSEDYDTDPSSSVCFAGFKISGDSSNTIYNIDEVMNMEIKDNMTFDIVWDTKQYHVKYQFTHDSANIPDVNYYYNTATNIKIMNQLDAYNYLNGIGEYYIETLWDNPGESYTVNSSVTFIASVKKVFTIKLTVNSRTGYSVSGSIKIDSGNSYIDSKLSSEGITVGEGKSGEIKVIEGTSITITATQKGSIFGGVKTATKTVSNISANGSYTIKPGGTGTPSIA